MVSFKNDNGPIFFLIIFEHDYSFEIKHEALDIILRQIENTLASETQLYPS